jgi:hypothetical protein
MIEDYTFSELCSRAQESKREELFINELFPIKDEIIEADENFFLDFTLETTVYHTGEINQVTRKPLTVIRKNSRDEDVVCPILISGVQINTALGDAVINSLVWYRGKGKLTDLPDCCLEEWAKREGFSGLYDADKYFSEEYGSDWLEQDLMTFRFKGVWVRDE